MNDMTYEEAIEKDKESDCDMVVYVNWDDEVNDYGVFGIESGFCYLVSSLEECRVEANEMNG